MFFAGPRRRRYDREVLQGIEQIRSAVERLEMSAAALKAPVPQRKRRAGRAFDALALLIISVYLLVQGSSGLARPEAVSTNFGNISVGLGIGNARAPTEYPFARAATIGIAVYVSPDLGSRETTANYTLLFPKRFVNRSFALMLEDAATLRNVRSSVATTQTAARSCTEVGGQGAYGYTSKHRCQVIYGTVPDGSGTESVSSPCRPFGLLGFNPSTAIAVQVSGDAKLVEQIDWAHSLISLPSTVGEGPPTVLDAWNGKSLRYRVGTPLQTGCKSSRIPTLASLGEMSDPPSSTDQFSVKWEGRDAFQNMSFVATARNQDSRGDLYIALGGLLGGVALSLIGTALSKK